MRYIIVDLEATCWKQRTQPERMEIIEIGSILLTGRSLEVTDEFSRFVRPINEPILSEFCKELTSIKQSDIDGANYFKTVFAEFIDWIGDASYRICSWGEYDMKQFRIDCKRHGISFPKRFKKHINLKQEFASIKRIRSCGMAVALQMLGMPLHGKHHRAIDDVRNIAKIAKEIIPMTNYFISNYLLKD